MSREIWEQNSGLRRLGAVMCFAALFLCGCASTVNVPDKLTASADVPKGYGTVIGSILMSAPTGAADIHKQRMIDALKAKKCEATIRRLSSLPSFARLTEYEGDKYRVSFEIDAEKPFIIRAPAGSYSFQQISQIVLGGFGTGCTMESAAYFDIREGETTYIGQLTIIAGFKSDKELKWMQVMGEANAIQIGEPWMPERFLNMGLSVTDTKEKTLRALGMDQSPSVTGLRTDLMKVGWDNWGYKVAPGGSAIPVR